METPANGTKFNVINAVYNGDSVTKTVHGISLQPGRVYLQIVFHMDFKQTIQYPSLTTH